VSINHGSPGRRTRGFATGPFNTHPPVNVGDMNSIPNKSGVHILVFQLSQMSVITFERKGHFHAADPLR